MVKHSGFRPFPPFGVFCGSFLPVIFRDSRSSAGFTLVELLVGVTLSAAVMAAVLSSYIFIGRNLARLANQQVLETEGRRTLASFSRDVRLASSLVPVSTSPTSPATNRVDLIVPTGSSSNNVTYYYNNGVAASVTINGASITMAANSLTRCLYNGITVTSLTLLRNITTGGLTVR